MDSGARLPNALCLDMTIWRHGHLAGPGRDIAGCRFASGPAHQYFGGRSLEGHHLHDAILGPITASAVNFARRTELLLTAQPQHSANSAWIADWANEPDAQA